MDIGFVGLAGSGKDTAALALVQHGWYRVAFADALKEVALSLGWDGVKDEKGRRFLQDLGMAARAYNPRTWISIVEEDLAPHARYVYTDVRFENEAEFIRNRGGILIRIIRPNLVSGSHVSESNTLGIKVNFKIVNDGTKEELHQKIKNIVNAYDKVQRTNGSVQGHAGALQA